MAYARYLNEERLIERNKMVDPAHMDKAVTHGACDLDG